MAERVCMDCGKPNDDGLNARCDPCKRKAADWFWNIWNEENKIREDEAAGAQPPA